MVPLALGLVAGFLLGLAAAAALFPPPAAAVPAPVLAPAPLTAAQAADLRARLLLLQSATSNALRSLPPVAN
jgi:hypothetical protein